MGMLKRIGNKKYCGKCGIYKDFSDYHKNKSTIDGLNTWCKECRLRYLHVRDGTKPNKLEFNFWKRVDKTLSPPCWTWKGQIDNGTPMYNRGAGSSGKGGRITARKLAYQLSRGDVPQGLFVVATCGNRLCVNPLHLQLITRSEFYARLANAAPKGDQQRLRKYPEQRRYGKSNPAYTHPESRPKGETHGRARLTTQDVKEIRRLYGQGVGRQEIAKRYNIAAVYVNSIVARRAWKHVD
jgi:hypothetical protein